MRQLILLIFIFLVQHIFAQVSNYNEVWNSQSENSSESMPCGGGDIGLNVWVENNELLFYMQQSGAFDENNTFLKGGRVRINFTPNIFENARFQQELNLESGAVEINLKGKNQSTSIEIWVEIDQPVIHVKTESTIPLEMVAAYENWRFEDQLLRKYENFQNSYKWVNPEGLMTRKDNINFQKDEVWFYHQNKGETVFDVTVKQQGLSSIKEKLYNPIGNLISGGCMFGNNFQQTEITSGKYLQTNFRGWQLKSVQSQKEQELKIALHHENGKLDTFLEQLTKIKLIAQKADAKETRKRTAEWWKKYWDRSRIELGASVPDSIKDVIKNYHLFRYMLGCNAYGDYPTKFNGGLFTYDPVFTTENRAFTPDFRNWGGGTFTAQNQRLVYFPMFRSGDTEMLKSQLNFYKNLLINAEARTVFYWNHKGASFTEQVENYGLPNPTEYGWKRPDGYDKSMQYNAWLEYQWDTSLEFCYMAILWHQYTGKDISEYIPMIESCLTFFDEHYQYLASKRGRKTLDEFGKLILYPGSACETYKMATNSTSTIAALKVVAGNLILLPDEYISNERKEYWSEFLKKIPEISTRTIDGVEMIAPAKNWERINNTESPQLYPVFPWGIYGLGRQDLELARNTYLHDPEALKFRGYYSWKQDAIWAAKLGLTDEAVRLVDLKLSDSGRKFPAFWGPGMDWVPDHNWGGSGMIALQEMLMQTNDDQILLFPAWPKEWDVKFKLHAPRNTIVEAELKNGKIKKVKVIPKSRAKDVVNYLQE